MKNYRRKVANIRICGEENWSQPNHKAIYRHENSVKAKFNASHTLKDSIDKFEKDEPEEEITECESNIEERLYYQERWRNKCIYSMKRQGVYLLPRRWHPVHRRVT